MAFNQTQFFENLEKLTANTINKDKKDDFIYEFLALLDVSKATITSLKKNNGRYNVAANPETGEVANKQRIYFKPVGADQDLAKTLNELKNSPIISQHKIRMIMVTNFDTVLVNDTKYDETLDCDFADLYKNYHFLLPMAGLERAREYSEHPADIQASEKMGRLFDHIRKHNAFDTTDDIHALNIFLTRLLFCLYAEDTGIFKPNQFHDIIDLTTNINGSDVHSVLFDLFEVLDLPESSADRKAMPTHLTDFPYVNGSLFEYPFAIPMFNARIRRILLECARLNWAEINPDIFGSMFQAVIDPEQRGNLGQHYTSVSNIMKVIQPLFLDELREELDTVIGLSNDNRHKNNKAERLAALLKRVSRIKALDPTCGSGNFLIIAYKELRRIEIDILKAQRDSMKAAKDNSLGLSFDSLISLNNFYGIEYDDFASQIARLSLWLAEHQMNAVFEQELGSSQPMLPLKDSGHIIHGNSLRLDWNDVCPNNGSDEIYVIGNPPFSGRGLHTGEQTEDMKYTLNGFQKFKVLDYVACWFWKGAKYIANSKAEMALVSTSSISQGIQVSMLFPPIFELGLSINFAYQSFTWSNNAKFNAGVHVVIIGLTSKISKNNTIFKLVDDIWHTEVVKNISPYLVSGNNTAVVSLSRPGDDRPKMVLGSMAKDGGHLLIENDEKELIVNSEPDIKKFIRRFIGSREFIHSDMKWCFWFNGVDLEHLKGLSFVENRLKKVKEFRESSDAKSTRDFAKSPHLFRQIAQPSSGSYIVVPRVSSERRHYIPMGFFDHKTIASDANQIIPNGTLFEFGLLTSKIHNDWMRLVAGRLKSDYRYSTTVVYNTFPFPEVTDDQRQCIEQLGEDILLARASNVGMTLAELYDPDKMPDDLKQAHTNLDNAVDKLYRSQGFANTEERLAHLLERYEKLIEAEKQNKNKSKKA